MKGRKWAVLVITISFCTALTSAFSPVSALAAEVSAGSQAAGIAGGLQDAEVSAGLQAAGIAGGLQDAAPDEELQIITPEEGLFSCGDFVYALNGNGTAVIYEYTGTEQVLQLPDSLDGYAVTDILNTAFQDCDSLISITIPVGILNIGDGAFGWCNNLKEVLVYPDNPCYECRENYLYKKNTNSLVCVPAGLGLTSFEIPEGVLSISGAFAGCTSLTGVLIPDSVVNIGDWAFWGCENLRNINIPDSVTNIGNSAFSFCSSLAVVEIPESVISIGAAAFWGCTGLTSLTIPKYVTAIGEGALFGCTCLTSLVVENENTVYDSRSGCNAIMETASNRLICGCSASAIPDTASGIGYLAFAGCSNLEAITVPDSVTGIEAFSFFNCNNLSSIEIGRNVAEIGENAFLGCKNLTVQVYEGSYAEDYCREQGILYTTR